MRSPCMLELAIIVWGARCHVMSLLAVLRYVRGAVNAYLCVHCVAQHGAAALLQPW